MCTVEVTPLKDKFSGLKMKEVLSVKSVDITDEEDFVPPPEKLEQLQRLGFNCHWCMLALQKFNCDMNMAAAFLFDKAIPLGEEGGDLPPSQEFLSENLNNEDTDSNEDISSRKAADERKWPLETTCGFDLGFQLASVCHNVQRDTNYSMGSLTALAACPKYNIVAYSDHHVVVVVDLYKCSVLYAAPLAAFDGVVDSHQSSEGKRISQGNLTLDDYASCICITEIYLTDSCRQTQPCVVVGSIKGGIFFYSLKTANKKSFEYVKALKCEYFFYDRGNMEVKHLFFLDGYAQEIEVNGEQWTDEIKQLGDSSMRRASRNASLVSQSSNAALVAPTDLQSDVKKDEKKEKSSSKMASQYLVVVSNFRIRTLAFPSKHFKIERVDIAEECEIKSACTVRIPGETCLYTFCADKRLRIYSIPELKVVYEYKSGVGLDRTAVCEDGRFVLVTGGNQVARYSSVAEENILNLPFSLGHCHVDDIEIPSRPSIMTPKGFLKTVMNVVTVGSTSAGDSERDELFKSDSKKPTYVAKRIETRAERQEKEKRMAEISTTGNALGEAGRRLNERTNKLDQMTDATERMKIESKQLNSNARALREKMEKKNKNWWLF